MARKNKLPYPIMSYRFDRITAKKRRISPKVLPHTCLLCKILVGDAKGMHTPLWRWRWWWRWCWSCDSGEKSVEGPKLREKKAQSLVCGLILCSYENICVNRINKFFLLDLKKDVKNYIKKWLLYQTRKVALLKHLGSLLPLTISNRMWESNSLDVIADLLRSQKTLIAFLKSMIN